MSSGYVLAGYGVTVGTLGLYAVWVLRRGRALSRSIPARPGGSFPRTWSEGDQRAADASRDRTPGVEG